MLPFADFFFQNKRLIKNVVLNTPIKPRCDSAFRCEESSIQFERDACFKGRAVSGRGALDSVRFLSINCMFAEFWKRDLHFFADYNANLRLSDKRSIYLANLHRIQKMSTEEQNMVPSFLLLLEFNCLLSTQGTALTFICISRRKQGATLAIFRIHKNSASTRL